MANTYTQIYIHVVFAVKFRQNLIQPEWESRLFQYITAIVQYHGHKLLQVNGVKDHIHLLINMKPTQSLSDLIKQVKQDSSRWINDKGLTPTKFAWQAGFGAFSYATSEVPNVIRYIERQKEHHYGQNSQFLDEYHRLLKEFDIDFNEAYVFKNPE